MTRWPQPASSPTRPPYGMPSRAPGWAGISSVRSRTPPLSDACSGHWSSLAADPSRKQLLDSCCQVAVCCVAGRKGLLMTTTADHVELRDDLLRLVTSRLLDPLAILLQSDTTITPVSVQVR